MSYLEWTDLDTHNRAQVDSTAHIIQVVDEQGNSKWISFPDDPADRFALARAVLGDPDAVIIRSDELPEIHEAHGDIGGQTHHTLWAGVTNHIVTEKAAESARWRALEYLAIARELERREQAQTAKPDIQPSADHWHAWLCRVADDGWDVNVGRIAEALAAAGIPVPDGGTP